MPIFRNCKCSVMLLLLMLRFLLSMYCSENIEMVRTYKRKETSHRQEWDENAMSLAIEEVRSGRMGYRVASHTYDVPKTTLERRVKNQNKLAIGSVKVMGNNLKVFSDEMENELEQYILRMEEIFFGLSLLDLRRLAYDLAERNAIRHPFNPAKKLAGEDWAKNFLRRHPNLSVRTPEATSSARARSFNRVNVTKFFDLLKGIQDEKHFDPTRIFNVDETGLTTVQGKPSRVVALRGKKQVGALTSAERGQLCTAEICMSAAGQYIPPLIIFPRKRMKMELMNGAPPGSIFECDPSGWMQKTIFVTWFQHFLKHSNSSLANPSLLIMDGHATLTKNLEVIEFNGVTLLVLPPHCSHRFVILYYLYYTKNYNIQ